MGTSVSLLAPLALVLLLCNSTDVWKKTPRFWPLSCFQEKSALSQCVLRSRWGEKNKKDDQSPPAAPLASKVFTKSPRLGCSIFCCAHREQVISRANQKCIHYRTAAVGESDCSFHLASGFWTGTIQPVWLAGKPFAPPHPPHLSHRHPSHLCHAQLCFSIKSNLIHTLDNVFPSITTMLLCKSCFLPNKSSEYF